LCGQYGYAADLLFIIALAISKLSVIFFLARLTPNKTHLRLCTAVGAICGAWGVGGVLSLALKCDLAEPWITNGQKCTSLVSCEPYVDLFGELTIIQIRRWQLISAFDVITEIIILVLIIRLVFNLQMSFRKKFMVVLGFAFRLP
jgi:hypothetical protein